jgi:hypothetical protein
MLNQLVHFLVGSVLVLSLLTLSGFVLVLLMSSLKKRRGADILKTVTVITGVLTATGALWVKATGARVTTADEGRDAIKSFYGHVANNNFQQAFDFIHPDRKEEMEKQNRTYSDFKNAYTSTTEYRNLQISFDKAESSSTRWYLVAYDVKDLFPLSTLREESWVPTSSLVDQGVVDQQKLINIVVADLRRNYLLSDDQLPKVLEYIRRAPSHYLFEPSFIEDVADSLHLKSSQASMKDSWSHHIELLEMQEQHGWKIRSGLHPPIFVAQYPPGTDPPLVVKAAQAGHSDSEQ